MTKEAASKTLLDGLLAIEVSVKRTIANQELEVARRQRVVDKAVKRNESPHAVAKLASKRTEADYQLAASQRFLKDVKKRIEENSDASARVANSDTGNLQAGGESAGSRNADVLSKDEPAAGSTRG